MLWNQFLSHTGNTIHKWKYYFPVYERFFQRYKNQSIVFFEIGVAGGGSLDIWSRYFGPLATIVGIDIDNNCLKYDNEFHKVRIGDQSDYNFLQNIINEFGHPDIVLDDGSHKMNDIKNSFSFLYPLLNNNGTYIVEDLHTCYWKDWGGSLGNKNTFIESCKDLIDIMHAQYNNIHLSDNHFSKSIFSMSFYDSMVVFEKKVKQHNIPIMLPKEKE